MSSWYTPMSSSSPVPSDMVLRQSISARSTLIRSMIYLDDAWKALQCWSWMMRVSRKYTLKELPIQWSISWCNQVIFLPHLEGHKPKLAASGRNIIACPLWLWWGAQLLPQPWGRLWSWSRWCWPGNPFYYNMLLALNPAERGDVLWAPDAVRQEWGKLMY